mmetsp:Transcript_4862/g.7399  ORF Transcript_4862/g.7399 Transcript_4862/m.7399 type:complete len:778 (-) Transcript_4862:72-2405(-)
MEVNGKPSNSSPQSSDIDIATWLVSTVDILPSRSVQYTAVLREKHGLETVNDLSNILLVDNAALEGLDIDNDDLEEITEHIEMYRSLSESPPPTIAKGRVTVAHHDSSSDDDDEPDAVLSVSYLSPCTDENQDPPTNNEPILAEQMSILDDCEADVQVEKYFEDPFQYTTGEDPISSIKDVDPQKEGCLEQEGGIEKEQCSGIDSEAEPKPVITNSKRKKKKSKKKKKGKNVEADTVEAPTPCERLSGIEVISVGTSKDGEVSPADNVSYCTDVTAHENLPSLEAVCSQGNVEDDHELVYQDSAPSNTEDTSLCHIPHDIEVNPDKNRTICEGEPCSSVSCEDISDTHDPKDVPGDHDCPTHSVPCTPNGSRGYSDHSHEMNAQVSPEVYLDSGNEIMKADRDTELTGNTLNSNDAMHVGIDDKCERSTSGSQLMNLSWRERWGNISMCSSSDSESEKSHDEIHKDSHNTDSSDSEDDRIQPYVKSSIRNDSVDTGMTPAHKSGRRVFKVSLQQWMDGVLKEVPKFVRQTMECMNTLGVSSMDDLWHKRKRLNLRELKRVNLPTPAAWAVCRALHDLHTLSYIDSDGATTSTPSGYLPQVPDCISERQDQNTSSLSEESSFAPSTLNERAHKANSDADQSATMTKSLLDNSIYNDVVETNQWRRSLSSSSDESEGISSFHEGTVLDNEATASTIFPSEAAISDTGKSEETSVSCHVWANATRIIEDSSSSDDDDMIQPLYPAKTHVAVRPTNRVEQCDSPNMLANSNGVVSLRNLSL